jgi:amino acid permease
MLILIIAIYIVSVVATLYSVYLIIKNDEGNNRHTSMYKYCFIPIVNTLLGFLILIVLLFVLAAYIDESF